MRINDLTNYKGILTEEQFKALSTSTLGSMADGIMDPSQQTEFLRLLLDESVLYKISKILRPTNRAGELNRITGPTRVAQLKNNVVAPTLDSEGKDQDATTLPSGVNNVRSSLTASAVAWTSSSIVALWEMSDDYMQFTIEGKGIVDTMLNVISARMNNDIEEFLLLSDTSTGTDNFLKQMNGWKRRIQVSGNVVNAASATFSNALVSQALRKIPTKWRKNPANLRLLVASNTAITYRDGIAARLTGLGDAAVQGMSGLRPLGIPMIEVPLIPTNLDVTVGTSPLQQGTFAILTDLDNLLTIIPREMALETDRDITKQTDIYALHMRLGTAVELEERATLIYNIRENPDA